MKLTKKLLVSAVLSIGLGSCAPAYSAPADEVNPFLDPQVVEAVNTALEHQCISNGYLVPASDAARLFFTQYEEYTEQATKELWKALGDKQISADLLLAFHQGNLKKYCQTNYLILVGELPEMQNAFGLNPKIYVTKGLNDEKINPSK